MHASLDPSYISRLRHGRRNPAKNESYIRNMAKYFSRHCTESYQHKALLEALKVSDICTEMDTADQIFQWLIDEHPNSQNVGRFLDRMTGEAVPPIRVLVPKDIGDVVLPERETSIYYGIDGKRKAVINFLSKILIQDRPITLLLFSDEPTDWMISDPDFAAKWASLMFSVLAKGNRIKIIHTVSRDLDEMLNAINQWMPLYMSGMIEPYYYPKKRDGIFKRTLFIAPGAAAVVSTSVGSMINDAANFLIRGAKAVAAIELEFNNYLKLCNPLMRIFTATSHDAYPSMMAEFENEQANTLMRTESLSFLTMPETVMYSIQKRIGQLNMDLLNYYHRRMNFFLKNICAKSYTEIIHLPDTQAVRSEQIAVAFSDILYGGTVYYTAAEFIQHLESIVSLLKENENFHICLIQKEADTRYMLYVKEEVGAIVAKTSLPPVILAINEENMTAAFWDFLKSFAGEKAYSAPTNQKTVKALSDYIRLLKA